MDNNEKKPDNSYNEPWDKNNIQWQRALSHYASWGVEFEEKEDNIITARQVKLVGHKILNQKQLIKRGRDLYPDKKYKIVPITYTLDVSDITPEWIQEQMKTYGVRPKDLSRQLAITPSTTSTAINGTRPISPPTKALFYYYFMAKRLSRELEGASEEEVAQAFAEALARIKERKAQETQE